MDSLHWHHTTTWDVCEVKVPDAALIQDVHKFSYSRVQSKSFSDKMPKSNLPLPLTAIYCTNSCQISKCDQKKHLCVLQLQWHFNQGPVCCSDMTHLSLLLSTQPPGCPVVCTSPLFTSLPLQPLISAFSQIHFLGCDWRRTHGVWLQNVSWTNRGHISLAGNTVPLRKCSVNLPGNE